MNAPLRPREVLFVEDDLAQATLACEALGQGVVPVNLHHVEDGDAALDFLRRNGPYDNAPRPDLILLDLNLPCKDGRETLAEIRADAELRSIVVVVMTTSRADEDVKLAYLLNANAYIAKALEFDDFVEAMRTMEDFFLRVAILPYSSP